MATYQIVDDIRSDALKLMKIRDDLTYLEAYKMAQKNLINNKQVTEYQIQPFSVELNLPKENVIEAKGIEDNSEYAHLANIIDINEYNDDQLYQFDIANMMGIDIKIIADKNYSPEQIKFLTIMLASDNNISEYIGNYSFNPDIEMKKMAQKEEQKVLFYSNQ